MAVPASIFTFLKFFGDNQFDVEVYYQKGIEEPIGNCEISKNQYVVDESLLESNRNNHVVAFYVQDNFKELSNIAARLNDTFEEEFDITVFSQDSISYSTGLLEIKTIENLTNVVHCGFILEDMTRLVLIDKQNRIRGYYSRDLEEIDRLIVELKIIIENDQRIEN